MKVSRQSVFRQSARLLSLVAGTLLFAACAYAEDKFVAISGAQCASPPVLHCPAGECEDALIINEGPVVEMKTRRTYFLDYPCDLKPGEKVMFVLSLHGGGSYGNWQRHYFPLMDYKDKYRLVIATPNSPIRVWSEADDQYLQNIVDFVTGQIGKDNIKSFWLVGHSQGGATANRIVRTDYFKSKVDGFLSLSGGRIGGSPGRADYSKSIRPEGPLNAATAAGLARPAAGAATAARPAVTLPDGNFSHIFATGRREMDEKGFPETSEWATKFGCGARRGPQEITDIIPGYVYDGSTIRELRPAWGLMPAGGKAQIFTFPDCKDGRVVADVTRLEKGHTEGYEPKITEELIKMMLSAKGGKLQNGG
jgi:pimeloyl-ACP methyl ester carboxylesterase